MLPITRQAVKEPQCWSSIKTKTKAISTFMVPNKGPNDYFVKAVVDFVRGCGCGRAILKSDFEPAIVVLQGAVKNSQHGVIQFLKIRRKGSSQSDGVAENAVREAERVIRKWKMSVEES